MDQCVLFRICYQWVKTARFCGHSTDVTVQ
jgi:hypothetical protein